MASAAARHHRCAVSLDASKEAAEACYLIGLAAECAIKYHLEQVGFNYQAKQSRRSSAYRDPIYLHFPELAAQVMSQGTGIVAGRILAHIANKALMQGWSVKMRYEKQLSDKVMIKRFKLWKQQTDAIFAEIGL
jgi:hypothetical protein